MYVSCSFCFVGDVHFDANDKQMHFLSSGYVGYSLCRFVIKVQNLVTV